MRLSPEMTVQDLLHRFPEAMRFFVRHRMLCVGCPSAPFHTLKDVAHLHDLTVESLLSQLNEVIADTTEGHPCQKDC